MPPHLDHLSDPDVATHAHELPIIMRLEELRTRLQEAQQDMAARKPSKRKPKTTASRVRARSVILVDFIDGDDRWHCTKCGSRFEPDPHYPSSQCQRCNPIPDDIHDHDIEDDR